MRSLQINHIHFLSVFLLLVTLSGCHKQHLINLGIAKERVEKYYESGQYEKELNKALNKAHKHFEKVSVRNNATIVLDIDDTLLEDYLDEKSIEFGYIPELHHEWVMRCDAPAIQQTKKLYDYLVSRGFKIILLTGRNYTEYDATIKNLKDQGFNTFDKLIVRQKDDLKLTADAYKNKRRAQLTKKGYRIISNIGDQWSDLSGNNIGYKVKLPNYKYIIH